MIKRIVVFCAESTGKSTLAARLGAHFGAPVVPEFVRGFWDERAGLITAEDLDTIARGQMKTEDAAAAAPCTKRLLFCDTDLLTNVLWADLLFPGKCPAWVRTEAEARCRNYTLYLLCDTDMAFAPDPQRCFPAEKDRQMCRQLWRETLVSRSLSMVEIRGEWQERERLAITAVESFAL